MAERIRRKRFRTRTCAADGCNERFIPIKEDHLYHSTNCASYMRVKEWREKKRKEAKREAAKKS